jgi:hypothetical protein
MTGKCGSGAHRDDREILPFKPAQLRERISESLSYLVKYPRRMRNSGVHMLSACGVGGLPPPFSGEAAGNPTRDGQAPQSGRGDSLGVDLSRSRSSHGNPVKECPTDNKKLKAES